MGSSAASAAPDGFGVALRALCRVLDDLGIQYHLMEFEELKRRG